MSDRYRYHMGVAWIMMGFGFLCTAYFAADNAERRVREARYTRCAQVAEATGTDPRDCLRRFDVDQHGRAY